MIRTCAKYEELFVDMMLVDELGLEPPGDGTPWKASRPSPCALPLGRPPRGPHTRSCLAALLSMQLYSSDAPGSIADRTAR